jgi:pentose-5-phosphate-3-epimerase
MLLKWLESRKRRKIFLRASALIQLGKQHYSCIALGDAEIHYDVYDGRYCKEYQLKFESAEWWNSVNPHREERAEALLSMIEGTKC